MNDRSPIENALRYIGGQRSGQLNELLKGAIEWPSGEAGVALRSLIEVTAVLEDRAPGERAEVLELLIKAGVEHPSVGPGEQSRERRVLRAAFRLPDPDIADDWAATLADRWEQLKELEQVFPRVSTSTTQPMEAAWTRALRKLEEYFERRFEELVTVADWQCFEQQHRVDGHAAARGRESAESDLSELRPASEHAQPFLVNLLVVTVFFDGRASVRRVTERVVTAQADGVEFYVARTYVGDRTFNRNYVPVRALWGCRADRAPVADEPGLIETRLRFTHPLRLGEQAYFATESVFDAEPGVAGDPDWADVNIDHHGIVGGRLHHSGLVPSSGLTIRACFDGSCVPVSAWWYAETTEFARTIQPPAGDSRVLEIVNDQVSRTFGQVCQPRESYGIGFLWGPD